MNDIKKDDEAEKSKDELLKEVKGLRKEITEDNKKKQQNSASNTMFVGGIICMIIFVFLLLVRCYVMGL